MTKKFAILVAASAMTMASPSLASTTINLDATDFSKSSETYTFAAGSYTVSLVEGLYKAWAPARSGIDIHGINIPTPNWTDYYDYTISGQKYTYNPFGGARPPRYADADTALAQYSAAGPLNLTFQQTTAVTFSISDYPWSFGDNSGGVSLSIAQAVPEPATWAMMLVGFFMTGAVVRSKGRTRRTALAAA